MKAAMTALENGLTRRRKAALLFVVSLLLWSVAAPVDGAALVPTLEGVRAKAADCRPETVDQVLMSYSFESYIPLFGKRQEDRQGIATVCGLMKSISDKGELKALPGEDDFRLNMQMSVYLTDGSTVVLSTAGQDRLAVTLETQRIVLQDADAYENFLRLAVIPKLPSLEPTSVHFGEKLRIKGENDVSESGVIYVFWTRTINNRSAQLSSQGVLYPSKDSVLIYKGTSTFGRYDFEIALPGYGEGFDGTTRRVLPGKGEITVSSLGWSWTPNVELLHSKTAFLSFNGVPMADPSFAVLMVDDRAYVPVRAIASLVDTPVTWDSATRSVLIRTKQSVAKPTDNCRPQLWIDGQVAASELQPVLHNGRAYVPIRAVTAAFDLPVHWDPDIRGVNVTTEATSVLDFNVAPADRLYAAGVGS